MRTGGHGHPIELPTTSAATVGLDDLDLEAVTGTDLVGRAERHDVSVRRCA
jgi:hypothetical protein